LVHNLIYFTDCLRKDGASADVHEELLLNVIAALHNLSFYTAHAENNVIAHRIHLTPSTITLKLT
jgi:hypothetical protein